MLNKRKDSYGPDKDRRRYERIQKSFILSYYDLANPSQKHEITQLKNISLGGICFITTRSFEPGTKLGIELKTPYIAGTTYLQGSVLQSHEKMKATIYETRLAFETLDAEATVLLEKLMVFFIDAKDHPYE
ncbi:MAG TPA: PilZ domain-containing protein [Candidatus Omnitrophota bacterium]|nr:PilZ domain-containing protein [Candidatus Omnitrophota bacterium]